MSILVSMYIQILNIALPPPPQTHAHTLAYDRELEAWAPLTEGTQISMQGDGPRRVDVQVRPYVYVLPSGYGMYLETHVYTHVGTHSLTQSPTPHPTPSSIP